MWGISHEMDFDKSCLLNLHAISLCNIIFAYDVGIDDRSGLAQLRENFGRLGYMRIETVRNLTIVTGLVRKDFEGILRSNPGVYDENLIS